MQKKKHLKHTFETSEEMDSYLEHADLSEAFLKFGKVVKPKFKKINIDLPEAMLSKVDTVAARLGVSRQPLLKIWIHQMLERELHGNA